MKAGTPLAETILVGTLPRPKAPLLWRKPLRKPGGEVLTSPFLTPAKKETMRTLSSPASRTSTQLTPS